MLCSLFCHKEDRDIRCSDPSKISWLKRSHKSLHFNVSAEALVVLLLQAIIVRPAKPSYLKSPALFVESHLRSVLYGLSHIHPPRPEPPHQTNGIYEYGRCSPKRYLMGLIPTLFNRSMRHQVFLEPKVPIATCLQR